MSDSRDEHDTNEAHLNHPMTSSDGGFEGDDSASLSTDNEPIAHEEEVDVEADEPGPDGADKRSVMKRIKGRLSRQKRPGKNAVQGTSEDRGHHCDGPLDQAFDEDDEEPDPPESKQTRKKGPKGAFEKWLSFRKKPSQGRPYPEFLYLEYFEPGLSRSDVRNRLRLRSEEHGVAFQARYQIVKVGKAYAGEIQVGASGGVLRSTLRVLEEQESVLIQTQKSPLRVILKSGFGSGFRAFHVSREELEDRQESADTDDERIEYSDRLSDLYPSADRMLFIASILFLAAVISIFMAGFFRYYLLDLYEQPPARIDNPDVTERINQLDRTGRTDNRYVTQYLYRNGSFSLNVERQNIERNEPDTQLPPPPSLEAMDLSEAVRDQIKHHSEWIDEAFNDNEGLGSDLFRNRVKDYRGDEPWQEVFMDTVEIDEVTFEGLSHERVPSSICQGLIVQSDRAISGIAVNGVILEQPGSITEQCFSDDAVRIDFLIQEY